MTTEVALIELRPAYPKEFENSTRVTSPEGKIYWLEPLVLATEHDIVGAERIVESFGSYAFESLSIELGDEARRRLACYTQTPGDKYIATLVKHDVFSVAAIHGQFGRRFVHQGLSDEQMREILEILAASTDR